MKPLAALQLTQTHRISPSSSFIGPVQPYMFEPPEPESYSEANENELQTIVAEVEAREKKASELARRTLDLIYPGEQQPESDHYIQFELSTTGVHNNRHFRRADGWFSYQLKSVNDAQQIAIVLHQNDMLPFDLHLNDSLLAATPEILPADEHGFVTCIFPIHGDYLKEQNTLRIQSNSSGSTPAIYEVRIMK